MRALVHNRIFEMSGVGLGTLALSACAIATPATITSTSAPALAVVSVEILIEDNEVELRSQFANSLRTSLNARGIATKSGADTIADFAVSERSADVGLQPITDSADSSAPLEPAFKSRWYHKCKPNRVNASLVLYARETGETIAKSSGEFLACPGDHSRLSDLARLLVDEAIAR